MFLRRATRRAASINSWFDWAASAEVKPTLASFPDLKTLESTAPQSRTRATPVPQKGYILASWLSQTVIPPHFRARSGGAWSPWKGDAAETASSSSPPGLQEILTVTTLLSGPPTSPRPGWPRPRRITLHRWRATRAGPSRVLADVVKHHPLEMGAPV